MTRLRRQIDRTGDPRLSRLLTELEAYADPTGGEAGHRFDPVAIPLIVTSSVGDLHLLSTIATFGTATDITVADLSIEAFYPADDVTRERLNTAARR